MKVKFYSADGVLKEERDLLVPTFEGNHGVQALKEVIIAYQANLRQENACTKTRAEVAGSGKKPYRQKGTGMARHGEKRSPIWRKGGVVFGPKPKDFSVHINKKVKRLALQRALFDRLSEQELVLFEGFNFSTPKCSEMAHLLKKIFEKGNILVVDNVFSENALLSMRNLDWAFSIDAQSVNAWDLLRYKHVVFTQQGMDAFLTRVQSVKE